MARDVWNHEHRHDTLIKMFDLLRALNTARHGGMTLRDLAVAAETSTRNVRRYVHALQRAGIGIEAFRDDEHVSRWRLEDYNACLACGGILIPTLRRAA